MIIVGSQVTTCRLSLNLSTISLFRSFSNLNAHKKNFILNQTGSTNSLNIVDPAITKFESSSTLLHSSPAFSIPKEIRFKDIYKKIKNDSIYTMPDTKSHRSTSIGRSLRPNIFKLNGNPSANKYQIKSIFDMNINQKKGYKFGGKLSYKVKKFLTQYSLLNIISLMKKEMNPDRKTTMF